MLGLGSDDLGRADAAGDDDDDGDALGELRIGGGVAYSRGSLTFLATGAAAFTDLQPLGRWLEASVGVSVHAGRRAVTARYVRTVLDPVDAFEVAITAAPVALFARYTDYRPAAGTAAYAAAGQPRTGVELGVGVTY